MQPITGVRAVLFDAVGTLIYPDPPVARAYYDAGRRFGSRLTEAEIADRFRQALQGSESAGADDGAPTCERQELARWRTIVAEVFHDVCMENSQQLFDELWSHFAECRNWAVFDDVAPTWSELCSRGVRLGLASNFDSRLLSICQGHPPLNRAAAEYIFYSSRVGWSKPSRKFYQAVERQLGLCGEQIMLVGDHYRNDVVGARTAGWRALLVDRQQPTKESILRLTEVVKLLA